MSLNGFDDDARQFLSQFIDGPTSVKERRDRVVAEPTQTGNVDKFTPQTVVPRRKGRNESGIVAGFASMGAVLATCAGFAVLINLSDTHIDNNIPAVLATFVSLAVGGAIVGRYLGIRSKKYTSQK